MPRGTNGIYTLPEASFVSGTTIRSAPVNNDYSDIAQALTESVATNGVSVMTGPFKAASGSVTAPSYTFASALGTGFYLSGTDELSWTSAGILKATFQSTGTVVWAGGASWTGSIVVSGSMTSTQLNLANTANDTGEYTIMSFALGNGSGNHLNVKIHGTGANDITQARFYVGSVEVARIKNNGIAIVGSVSTEEMIFLATGGFADYLEITTPSSPATDKARMYAKDLNSVTRMYYLDSAGIETEIGAAGELVAVIEDRQATGVAGNILTTATANNVRGINTIAYVRNASVSVSSNRFTLPVGAYEVEWFAPLGVTAVGAMNEVSHQSILYNQTDGAEAARGSSGVIDKNADGVQAQNFSRGRAVVSVSVSKAFEIRHQLGTAGGATIVTGIPASLAGEIYTQVMVRRA